MNKSTTYRGESDPYRPQPAKHQVPAPAAPEVKPAVPEVKPAAVVHEPGKLYEGDTPVPTHLEPEPPAHS